MIHHGWLYLTTEQYQGVHKNWNVIQAWLDARGLFMEEGWEYAPANPYFLRSHQHPRIILCPMDARKDFDRAAAFFEFKIAWL